MRRRELSEVKNLFLAKAQNDWRPEAGVMIDVWLKRLLAVLILLLSVQGSVYAREVTLEWDESIHVEGYLVYYDTDSGVPYDPPVGDYAEKYSTDGRSWKDVTESPPIVVGSGITRIILRGLRNDVHYFFAVRAFEYEDQSQYSREISSLAPSNIEPPYNSGWCINSGDLKGFKVLYNNVTDPGMTPTLGFSGDIPAIDLPGLVPVGLPLNLGASGPGMFNTPVTVFIPCPGRHVADYLSIALYDGNQWILACDQYGEIQPAAQGWMVGEPEYYDQHSGYPRLVAVRLTHFSGVQAAAVSTTGNTIVGASGGGCLVSTTME
jgi:hypothetical protein